MIRLLCLYIFIISSSIFSSSDQLARSLYLNKNYEQSKIEYEKLVAIDPNNFSYNYNLSSVYFRLDNMIQAKAYCLKALKIRPNHIDARHNLSIINKQFIDKQFINDYSQIYINFQLLQVFLYLVSIFILFLIWLRVAKKELISMDRIIIIASVLWVSFAVVLATLGGKNSDIGVVKDKKLEVLSGPSKTQASLFFVHQGAEFKIIKESTSWLQIQFNNGLKGWVENIEVIKI